MMLRRISWLVLCVPLVACTSGAAGSSGPTATSPTTTAATTTAATTIVLREAPDDAYCDVPGSDDPAHSLTFRIDPAAAEQVTALTDTGVTFVTYWSPEFQPGTDAELVIRDPAGQDVVKDGDTVQIPEGTGLRLQGYLVLLCSGAAQDRLYILFQDPE